MFTARTGVEHRGNRNILIGLRHRPGQAAGFSLTTAQLELKAPWRFNPDFAVGKCKLHLTGGLKLAYSTAEFFEKSAHDLGSPDPGLTHIE